MSQHRTNVRCLTTAYHMLNNLNVQLQKFKNQQNNANMKLRREMEDLREQNIQSCWTSWRLPERTPLPKWSRQREWCLPTTRTRSLLVSRPCWSLRETAGGAAETAGRGAAAQGLQGGGIQVPAGPPCSGDGRSGLKKNSREILVLKASHNLQMSEINEFLSQAKEVT